jgi:hypothetical protein
MKIVIGGGGFEGPKHDPELKNIADTINVKVCLSRKGNPFLNEVES